MRSTPQNYYQGQTSARKLRGQFYTPSELVALILEALPLEPMPLVIDPACGDGSFLRGVVAALARRGGGAPAPAWADRLVGFDLDPEAVAATRGSLQQAFRAELGLEIPADRLHVQPADVLSDPDLASLLARAGVPGRREEERLLVVGNPPYVEAKRLDRGTTATLKRRYPDALTGAPDLYLYFLHVCLGWLREGDLLAFVLPNKLLVNANAQRLRERLLGEGRLRGLWLATQAGIFVGAAVYPVVLFAGGPRRGASGEVAVAQITRSDSGTLARSQAVVAPSEAYGQTSARAFFPWPRTRALCQALELLLEPASPPAPLLGGEGRVYEPPAAALSPPSLPGKGAGGLGPPGLRLADLLDIRWTVSFHRAGLREQYVTRERPDDPHARPFLGGGPFTGNGEVSRCRIEWAGWWIRYDTGELQARGNPLPDLGLFERPKLVICQNGRTLRAAYDDCGFVLKDTFLCGVPRVAEHPLCRFPRALVGLLCSRAVHFFYSHVFFGGHVNGGYLHFLRSFLIDIPVGNWTDAAAEEVAALVRQREAAGRDRWEELEEQIEARVGEALGLSPEQSWAIAEWATGDANWQARERVRPAVPTRARKLDPTETEHERGGGGVSG